MELLPFFIALQIFCFLTWAFNIFGGAIQYPLGSVTDLTNTASWFGITPFSALVGAGAITIGIVALLFKANTYAIYAMLLFGVGIMFDIVQKLLFAIPNTILALTPEAINPTPGSTNPILVAITVLIGYAAFWYIFNLVVQRND